MRTALGFLTVLRVGGPPTPPGAGALAVFPLVGTVIGVVWLTAAKVGAAIGGELVAAALVLVVDLVATGGMHLDALADVADGVASRLPPLEAQAVMREPHIGAVGAATLVTALILRFALVTAALSTPAALIAAPAVGRAAMVCALARMPEGAGSLASALVAAARGSVVAATLGLVALVAAGALALSGQPSRLVVTGAVVATGATLLVGAATGRWWARRFACPSGDIVGAVGVVAELLVLASLLVLR